MLYWMKPLPEVTIEEGYKPFIKHDWFRRHFMIFVYILQANLLAASMWFGVWFFSNIFVRILLFALIYVCHELLHVVVVWRNGDLSLTHSGIFLWLNSDAHMSKMRFWFFMTLPFLTLTVVPAVAMFFVDGTLRELLNYVAWVNAIVAGADIINSFLILIKPRKSCFYRGFYKCDNVKQQST